MAATTAPTLSDDILAEPVQLTRALVDIESVSGNETAITDAVVAALAGRPHLTVERDGNVVLARTSLGRAQRVAIAGHLDTVPVAGNLPATTDGDLMYGCGTSDMKAGVAVALHLAATLTAPVHDVSYLFYDCEEIEAERNGLNRIARERPDWLTADFAILGEPTHGLVEAGCQGTMRVAVRTTGVRAHSARSWLGTNAIHAAGDVLSRLAAYTAREVTIDGCDYREGLNAVHIAGGVAGNVIPDECVVSVNYRFAPDRSEADALTHLQDVFAGYDLEVTDSAPGALPGLTAPAARQFLTAVGQQPRGKLGWTDVARFAALGIPALNYGPGDPNLAHTRNEHVEIPRIRECATTLHRFFSGL